MEEKNVLDDFSEVFGAEKEENAFDELEEMFKEDEEIAKAEKVVLKQNLEGFASCFPEWDLHRPR